MKILQSTKSDLIDRFAINIYRKW